MRTGSCTVDIREFCHQQQRLDQASRNLQALNVECGNAELY
jgi:hypothetical protein